MASHPLPLRPTKMEVAFKCYSWAHSHEAYRMARKHPEWKCTLVIMPAHIENITYGAWPPFACKVVE